MSEGQYLHIEYSNTRVDLLEFRVSELYDLMEELEPPGEKYSNVPVITKDEFRAKLSDGTLDRRGLAQAADKMLEAAFQADSIGEAYVEAGSDDSSAPGRFQLCAAMLMHLSLAVGAGILRSGRAIDADRQA